MTDDQMKALREAVEDGHLRVSVSVGVGSPVATIGTRELLDLVHAGQRVLSSPRVERARALEEAAAIARAHRDKSPEYGTTLRIWSRACAQIEDAIRARIRSLSPTDGAPADTPKVKTP